MELIEVLKGLNLNQLAVVVIGLLLLKGAPKVWTTVTEFINQLIAQREKLLTDTVDKLFKHAQEDRALYREEMQKERDFHARMWEQAYSRETHVNGTGPREYL